MNGKSVKHKKQFALKSSFLFGCQTLKLATSETKCGLWKVTAEHGKNKLND